MQPKFNKTVMVRIRIYAIFVFWLALSVFLSATGSCSSSNQAVVMGADRMGKIKTLVNNRRVGLIANQTSILQDGTHLLDALLQENIQVVKVFAPEHGFRGTDDAGATIRDSRDSSTGTPIVSLYGNNSKPSAAQLSDIDLLIFDIQDVGTRFFTYISTMHYAMEACAENGVEFIVLDRPNPNDYVDGPILKKEFSSFVGIDPIPVLHGLTVGELAQMINGEGWIATGKNSCNLHVVRMKHWRHGDLYQLPVKPSPNLPNNQAIRLYPSLCFFEGTSISVGRGTTFPFQVLGNPDKKFGTFGFTPQPIQGMDTNPMYRGVACYGTDLRDLVFEGGLSLRFVLDYFGKSGFNEQAFFARPNMFDLLAGTDALRLQIIRGFSEEEIRSSWENELNEYKEMREKYLLYSMREKYLFNKIPF